MILEDETTNEQKIMLEKKIKEIEEREIIEKDPEYKPHEIKSEKPNQILAGPPTLTRFEKARIIGARGVTTFTRSTSIHCNT